MNYFIIFLGYCRIRIKFSLILRITQIQARKPEHISDKIVFNLMTDD